MASFINKLNPVPAFPPFNGPYNVGTKDVEIAASDLQDASSTFAPVSTIQFRCFYPCEPPSKSSKPVYWVQAPQRSTVSAYCRFSGLGSNVSSILSYFPQVFYHMQIPAHRNASLLPPATSSKRWPVLVFSHGLGGSRNSYSQICGTLASYGIVVIAPEHRDGSCAISHVRATNSTGAYAVDYKKFSHKPSPEVYEGRDEMLRIRLWEVALLHEALRKIDAGHDLTYLDAETPKNGKPSPMDCLSTFREKLSIHDPGSIIYAGHSFGSATVVQYLKSLYYHPNNPYHTANGSAPRARASDLLSFQPSSSVLNQITPETATILLDLWTLPLNSPTQNINQLPMPCFNSPRSTSGATTKPQASSVLAVLSSAFVNWTANFKDVKRVLADPNKASHDVKPSLIFYPLSSAHLSQSDFGILFPRLVKYFGKAEEPERTLKLNSRAILQMLRARGFEVAGKDDAKILSLTEGAVRGWVAVGADSASHENHQLQEKETSSIEPVMGEAQVVGNGELAGST